MKKILIAVFCAANLAACATLPPPDTPSGKLEMTVDSANAACIRSEITNTFINNGFAVKSINDYQIVLGRMTENAMASMLLGTPAGGSPEERVTLTLIPQSPSGSLRIIWEAAYIANSGTGMEKSTPMGSTQADQLQLIEIKRMLEEKCTPPSE